MQNLIPRVPKAQRVSWHSVTAYNSHTSDKNCKPLQQQWEINHQGNLTFAQTRLYFHTQCVRLQE